MRCSASLVLFASLSFVNGAVNSTSCQDCHPSEFALWTSSHHALAERQVSPSQERIAFVPPRRFKAGSITNETWTSNGQFQIITLGFQTNIAPYQVDRVIGVDPVRQFLTASTNGRWQTQEVSYDPISNQWFDVYGDEDRRPGEWGHWTGRGMNWNSSCAECHNTNLRKNYDEATDSYHTTMDEMGVGCASCHANLAEHLTWQRAHPGNKTKDPTVLRPTPQREMGTCGSCHALKDDLTADFVPGDSFFDHYQMQIVDDSDRWYADGQVHGEDYEFASFTSSKMHERGVTYMDCHNPHSAKPLLGGNDLCMKCHCGAFTNAPIINPLEHSHHLASNKGNSCVGCHMPVTVYMQRHPRHDHGFTSPDPLLTKELNIPNACNRCHVDKLADWAVGFTDQWYGQKMNRPTRDRARWIAVAQKGDASAKGPLLNLLSSGKESPYWRAVIAGLLWQWAEDQPVKSALMRSLKDEHPLVREQAVKSLEPSLNNEATEALKPLLNDPVRNARVAAAWALRATLATNTLAGKDLIVSLDFNADQPAGQYRQAMFDLARQKPTNALAHLRTAEAWDPYSPPVREQTAKVLLQLGLTNEARLELQKSPPLKNCNLRREHYHPSCDRKSVEHANMH